MTAPGSRPCGRAAKAERARDLATRQAWEHRLHSQPGDLCGCGIRMDNYHRPSGECFVEGWPTCVQYPSLRLCFGWAPGDPEPGIFRQALR